MMNNEVLKVARSRCLRLSCVAAAVAAILISASAFAAVPIDADGKYKIYGDMRIRGEADNAETQSGTKKSRNRLRYRARVGVSFMPNDNWSGKIRLATTSSQNSPHVDFATVGNTADLSIGIDTAFIAYTGVNNLTVVGGKTPLNFWQQNEVFWDTDINPEALAVVYKAGPVTLNGAYAVLTKGNWDTSPSNMTAFTYQAVFQGGDSMKYTAALGGGSVSGEEITFNATQHTMVSGQLKGGAWLAGADYLVSNSDAENTAYVVQGRYKVTRTVGLRAYYYHVEAFATLGDGMFTQDNFPSNRSSADNFSGYRLQLDYKISKGTSVDFRYYDSTIITRGLARLDAAGVPGGSQQHAKNSRAQVNVNLKF